MPEEERPLFRGFDPITALEAIQLSFGGVQEIDEGEELSTEWDALYRWARDNGALYTEEVGEFLNKSGHEHDVFLDDPSLYFYKKTKWNCAGYTFDPETMSVRLSSVREYLTRLVLHNELFNTGIELLGLIVKGKDRAIFTRQCIITGEIPSSMDEMDVLICQQYQCEKIKEECNYLGYKGNVYKTSFFYLADIRPDNCKIITAGKGKRYIVPFDCFVSIDVNELMEENHFSPPSY